MASPFISWVLLYAAFTGWRSLPRGMSRLALAVA
jgi:hypothetical protein